MTELQITFFLPAQELRHRLVLTEQHRQSLIWQKQYLLLILQSHSKSRSVRSKQQQQQQGAVQHGGGGSGGNLASFFANFPRLRGKDPLCKFR